jgi:plasmid stabilization system protein ParE
VNVRVRPAFYEDLAREQLWLLEHASAEVADRWHEAVWATIQFLERNPALGRIRSDLDRPGIRSWRVNDFKRWLIFYGERDDDLILFRIVSGAMNLPALAIEN